MLVRRKFQRETARNPTTERLFAARGRDVSRTQEQFASYKTVICCSRARHRVTSNCWHLHCQATCSLNRRQGHTPLNERHCCLCCDVGGIERFNSQLIFHSGRMTAVMTHRLHSIIECFGPWILFLLLATPSVFYAHFVRICVYNNIFNCLVLLIAAIV